MHLFSRNIHSYSHLTPIGFFLEKFCFLRYVSKWCWPIKMQGSLRCNNISRKKWMMKFWACRETSKFSTSWFKYFGCIQNKFDISLQYPKENMKDQVDFLHAGKRQKFLQIDTIVWGVCGQVCPNYPKKQICYLFTMS